MIDELIPPGYYDEELTSDQLTQFLAGDIDTSYYEQLCHNRLLTTSQIQTIFDHVKASGEGNRLRVVAKGLATKPNISLELLNYIIHNPSTLSTAAVGAAIGNKNISLDHLQELWDRREDLRQTCVTSYLGDYFYAILRGFARNPNIDKAFVYKLLFDSDFGEKYILVEEDKLDRDMAVLMLKDLDWAEGWPDFRNVLLHFVEVEDYFDMNDLFLFYRKREDRSDSTLYEKFMLFYDRVATSKKLKDQLIPCLNKHSGLDFDFNDVPRQMIPAMLNWNE